MDTRDDELTRRRSTVRPDRPGGRTRTALTAPVPLWMALAAALAALVVAFTVGRVTDAVSSDSTITVHGSVTLSTGSFLNLGASCSADGGFSDISAGTAVTIGDQTGAIIAVGQLEPGRITQDASGTALLCSFGFDVQVPGGRAEYTVTVSHRGTQVVSPAQTRDVELTLGS